MLFYQIVQWQCYYINKTCEELEQFHQCEKKYFLSKKESLYFMHNSSALVIQRVGGNCFSLVSRAFLQLQDQIHYTGEHIYYVETD